MEDAPHRRKPPPPLPLDCVPRTSELSRAWRPRWEPVPSLRILRSDDAPPAVFSAVHARYACPVREFFQCFLDREACGHTDEWIRLLAGKVVQSLTLFFGEIGPGRHTIQPRIFSCLQLTRLSLGHCRLPSAPWCFTGFPNLTSLSLTWVGVPELGERNLEAIISSALSLRLLELVKFGLIAVTLMIG